MKRDFSKENLVKLYWQEGLSTREIARKFGVVQNAVRYWMEKHKIKRRTLAQAHAGGPPLGEKHFGWKGESVGYFSLHKWVKRHRGSPSQCEHCGKDNLKNQEINWANKSHKYKRKLDDWIRLCVRCHRQYDKKFRQTL